MYVMIYNKTFKKKYIVYINMSTNEDADKKKVTEELVSMVKNYVKFDNEIRKAEKKVKELKKERKDYEEFVLDYMGKEDIKVIDITNGKLRRNKSNTKTGLTPAHIQTCLYDAIGDSAKAQKLTQYIMEKRPSVERVNLKRTALRGKDSK